MNWIMFLAILIASFTVGFALDANPKTYRLTKQLCFALPIFLAMYLFAYGRSLL